MSSSLEGAELVRKAQNKLKKLWAYFEGRLKICNQANISRRVFA